MTDLTPTFDPKEFEKYGSYDPFLTPDQKNTVEEVTQRVNSQLDWLGQALGWSGPLYWGKLASTVQQKRNLLVGSLGFYNGFLIPEVKEIRRVENKFTIKGTFPLKPGQSVFLGEKEYNILSVAPREDETDIFLESITDEFLKDISSGQQIKVIDKSLIPNPFFRPLVETSGDCIFNVEINGESLVLFPEYDFQGSFPFVFNTLYEGSRYWFNAPVKLESGEKTIYPEYDFSKERWWIQLPEGTGSDSLGLTGTLIVDSSQLQVRIKRWKDPSDWVTKSKIDNFSGVWGNKGGELPLHFVFDALSLHGFNETLSVKLEPFERSIPFDKLLEFVYLQRVSITYGLPDYRERQVWWNPGTGSFSFYTDGEINCGPWVETDYPTYKRNTSPVDFVFPDSESFTSSIEQIQSGDFIYIANMAGLGSESNVLGITQTLLGPGAIKLFRPSGEDFWKVEEIVFETVEDFSLNCENLPEKVQIVLKNSSGLSPEGLSYRVGNLGFPVTEPNQLLLMKGGGGNDWHIYPPSNLKYIGKTRLFGSSGEIPRPLEGEMNWDFGQPDPDIRDARVFYYNRWEKDPETDEWVLTGDWVSVKENSEPEPLSVPDILDFGTVKVYCDGVLLENGVSFFTDDFGFSYSIDESTGSFIFSYTPVTYFGSVSFPQILISDSLTGVFTFDISKQVFSGLRYYMSPNVEDSETLLRVWKTIPLQVSDTSGELASTMYFNPLRADTNKGPSDPNWSRYFLRLPPTYGRDELHWQKISLACQNFCYWGTSLHPEDMKISDQLPEPAIYEKVSLYGKDPSDNIFLYSEPYWYSDILFSFPDETEYENSNIVPGFDKPFDDFLEAEVVDYSPLHERMLDSSPSGLFGEWAGRYYTSSDCVTLSGHLVNDILSENLQSVTPPIWDSSIYKFPSHNRRGTEKVDANNFKIGYAFFAADLSSAEDAVFEFNPGTDSPGGGGAPEDSLDNPPASLQVFPSGPLVPGSAVFMPEGLCGPGIEPEWRWFRFGEEVPGEKERYSVIWFTEVTPGQFEPLRGEYRCTGGEWEPYGLATPEIAPLPAGREVEFYWDAAITRFGFSSPIAGWRSADFYLRVVTLQEFINFEGNPSTFDEIYQVDPNGNATLLTNGSNARVWISKSRYRDNGGPWQELYDYEQFR